MSFLVTKVVRAKVEAPALPEVAPMATLPQAVPATTLLLSADRKLSAVTAHRGLHPTPTSLIGRVFNHSMSWGIVASVSGFVATSPVLLVGTGPGIAAMGTAAGLGGFLGAMLGDLTANRSPLEVVASYRTLTPEHVAFIEKESAESPLACAVLGLLAERWIKRIDSQRVRGNEAMLTLERAAKRVESVPPEVRAEAERAMALGDAVVGADGQFNRRLSDADVQAVLTAFENISANQRQSTAAELLRLYFKGDVPRVHFETQPGERRLYRALRDMQNANANNANESADG